MSAPCAMSWAHARTSPRNAARYNVYIFSKKKKIKKVRERNFSVCLRKTHFPFLRKHKPGYYLEKMLCWHVEFVNKRLRFVLIGNVQLLQLTIRRAIRLREQMERRRTKEEKRWWWVMMTPSRHGVDHSGSLRTFFAFSFSSPLASLIFLFCVSFSFSACLCFPFLCSSCSSYLKELARQVCFPVGVRAAVSEELHDLVLLCVPSIQYQRSHLTEIIAMMTS